MKNKKNIIAIAATLILALSAVTVSAAASSPKDREKDKIETMPEIVCASSSDNCNYSLSLFDIFCFFKLFPEHILSFPLQNP